ncbi:MAG: GlsB/YeaQ/YmgE family stress response membrane protein [Caulobacteraceae bacterium]
MLLTIIAWLILGGVAGFIASKIVNKTGEGLVMDIVLGIIGAIVGGFISSHFLGGIGTGHNILSIPTLIVAVLGAIVVLVIYHMIVRRRV